MSASIVVVGSTMIDMIAYVGRVPAAGETVVGDRFTQGFGGKGANQAVMAARLGASVRMVNCLGDDVLGDTTIENFEREGIDVSGITRARGTASGVAPIWVEPDGTNRIIVVPGANHDMTPDQARTAVTEAAEVDAVIGQLEIPQEVTAAGFEAARARGAVTVLNPAPAAELQPALLAATDWLTPNETEFAALSGAKDTGDEAIAAYASATGLRLIVTLGADGAALCADGTVTRVPAPSGVAVVDTTGAGDAFVGAFCFGLASGLGPLAAARLGCECASLSVTKPGTQASFPGRDGLTDIRRRLGIGAA